MKTHRAIYVEPVFKRAGKKIALIGWKWEALENGKLLAFSDVTHPSIETARADGERAIREEHSVGKST